MNIAEAVYNISLDTSYIDDEFGDVESSYGWNALILGGKYAFWISQDNYGFKDCEYQELPADKLVLEFNSMMEEYNYLESCDFTPELDCLVCNGTGEYMGSLGDRMYYRCVNCGGEFYRT